jgi:hypothetical protein
MDLTHWAQWGVLLGYCALTVAFNPRGVTATQFFRGQSRTGAAPSVWLVAASAAISWIFAKSIANAADLGQAFGIVGGLGYAIYYLSFGVAAATIYLIRTRGGYVSLSAFLVGKYGAVCARLFLLTISIRLFNEVWSNTKVTSLYFGPEGSEAYWAAAIVVTVFTLWYAWTGGLRSSLLTDSAQMILASILLALILMVVFPPVAERGLPSMPGSTTSAGITFCLLALVQILSYPFHDPVLTDRAFISPPKRMIIAFMLGGVMAGGFIFLFSTVGLYALAFGLSGSPSVSVPSAFGLAMLMVFNGIMLTSGGSTIDSAFTSTAKWAAQDWRNRYTAPTGRDVLRGRIAMVLIAMLGNLPLLAVYLPGKTGPAIIAATTISGTMVMGLAPIFLLSFVRSAGQLSFHLAFWPGLLIGIGRTLEGATGTSLFPAWLQLGTGKYALDLGLNVYGLALCTIGYLLGALLSRAPVSKLNVAVSGD